MPQPRFDDSGTFVVGDPLRRVEVVADLAGLDDLNGRCRRLFGCARPATSRRRFDTPRVEPVPYTEIAGGQQDSYPSVDNVGLAQIETGLTRLDVDHLAPGVRQAETT